MIWRLDELGAGQISLDDEAIYYTGAGGLVAAERSSGHLKWKAQTNPSGARPFGLGTAVAGNVVAIVDFNLLGFDKRSGRKLWEFVGVGMYAVASSNPVSDGIRFYIGSGDGIVYAVSPSDGSLVWKADRPTSYHVLSGTPKVHGDLVIVPYFESREDGRGAVAALDRETGAVRWLHEFKQYVGEQQSAACLSTIDIDSERVYASFGPGNVIALDRTTGAMEWHRGADSESVRGAHRRPLAVVNGTVVVGSVYGYLEGISSVFGDLVWTRHVNLGFVSAGSISWDFAHDGQYVFVTPTGRLAAIDVSDGRTVWSHGFRDSDEWFALDGPGAVADSSLYITGVAGLFAFRR